MAAADGPRRTWRQRLLDGQQVVSTYLPLLLMALLALATWWLVQNTPGLLKPSGERPKRHEPDYSMQDFTVERFRVDGRLTLRIQGREMRHYPDDDTLEIDQPRLRAVDPQGRLTVATARLGRARADGSEVQLLGDADVRSESPDAPPVEFRSEFLHAFIDQQRLRTHLPVRIRQAGSEMQAQGLDYDHARRLVQTQGRSRASFPPSAGRGGAR
ncbi:LPS export ABC transporter periplasmic protein LptC [Aquabacterium sp. J223]|uniref:LPS export ABC transporter periplasmic protein LptC n=1 Tax=Aquabacterium sp. J223 TaxID=2898431 RepID=UPI0021ADA134|nr:LPS export ABC transporter periplasmic protein LptC [Aquabacterium sp. J223]UUX96117.1 LPS export ABC transporter periplasmic protein LptC [Aquabacterium sp. J223]